MASRLLLSSRLLIQFSLPETREQSIMYCIPLQEPFACCLPRIEMSRTFFCSHCPYLRPLHTVSRCCAVLKLPLMSKRWSCQSPPLVCLNCFHRERITGSTDEFCILSAGTATLPSPFLHTPNLQRRTGGFNYSRVLGWF